MVIPFLSEKGIGFTCGDKTSDMGRVGFEPTTNALKGHCSTTELPTQSPPDEIRTRKACANGF